MESRFFPLLVVLVFMVFFAYPLLLEAGHSGLLVGIFMAAMFLVSFRALLARPALLRLLVALAIPMFGLRIALATHELLWLYVLHDITSMAFFGLVTLVCLSRVVDNSPVTEDKILGAICVYLLIGILFAFVYSLLYLLDPGSIQIGGPVAADARTFWAFTYFSFVTLTTLGYGDVLPVSLMARSMATLEAIVGPLYLAILIARLVSVAEVKPRHGKAT